MTIYFVDIDIENGIGCSNSRALYYLLDIACLIYY